jgi:hypothetical protein
MRKLLLFLLAILLLISSLFAEAQDPSKSGFSQAVTEEEVRAFVDEYIDAYNKMDLDGFMALFSKDAVENRMYPYNDIYQGYGKQFGVSKGLKYHLTIFSVKTYARSAHVSGQYVMNQTLKGWGGTRVYKGDIRFDLVRENSSLKIRQINYGMSR